MLSQREEFSLESACDNFRGFLNEGPNCAAGASQQLAAMEFMERREDSRMSSMRLRTLNLASREETWNLTVRSERFNS